MSINLFESHEAPGGARRALIQGILDVERSLFRARCELQQPPLVELDITMLQLKALSQLPAPEGVAGLRVSDLAGRLGVTPATTSTMVDRLVERGLVERREDPQDRRQHRCRLSPAGQEILTRFFEAASAHSRILLESLTEDELTTVLRGVETLLSAFDRLRSGAPPQAETPS